MEWSGRFFFFPFFLFFSMGLELFNLSQEEEVKLGKEELIFRPSRVHVLRRVKRESDGEQKEVGKLFCCCCCWLDGQAGWKQAGKLEARS